MFTEGFIKEILETDMIDSKGGVQPASGWSPGRRARCLCRCTADGLAGRVGSFRWQDSLCVFLIKQYDMMKKPEPKPVEGLEGEKVNDVSKAEKREPEVDVDITQQNAGIRKQ